MQRNSALQFLCRCAGIARIDALGILPMPSNGRIAAVAAYCSTEPGNTASILVFNVAALNGLTM